MKNHVRLIALAAAMLIACAFIAGCSGKKTDNDAQAIAPGSAFKDSRDMAVVVNGVTYPVRVDSANVLSALGNDYDYFETVSCVYKGYDKSFEYDDIKVSTVPVDDVDIIEMFTITGGDHSTPRGIKVGASRRDVLTAYGENYTSDDGFYITYTENGDPDDYSAMRIMFKMEGDTVTEICVYSPSYTND